MNNANEKYFLLLNNRLDRVREVKSLTLVLFDILETDDYVEMSKALGRRDFGMEDFHRYGEEIRQLGDLELSEEEKVREANLNRQTEGILSEIRNCNEKLRRRASEKKDDYQKELKELRHTEKGVMGYVGYSIDGESRFFDKKC